jgi:cell division protein ZapB
MSGSTANSQGGLDAGRTADELDRIARHLEDLRGKLDQLQQENRLLHERQEALVAERASLVQRNEEARSRVEGMIERLKALELAGIS